MLFEYVAYTALATVFFLFLCGIKKICRKYLKYQKQNGSK